MALWMPYVSVIYTIAFVVITALVNEHSALYKAVPWIRKPPVLISNRSEWAGSASARPRTYLALDQLDTGHLMQAPLASSSAAGSAPHWASWLLLALHFTTAFYCGVELLVSRFADRDLDISYFTYFTNWSLMLLALAGLTALANTARHMARRRRAGQALAWRGLPAAAKAAELVLRGAPADRVAAAAGLVPSPAGSSSLDTSPFSDIESSTPRSTLSHLSPPGSPTTQPGPGLHTPTPTAGPHNSNGHARSKLHQPMPQRLPAASYGNSTDRDTAYASPHMPEVRAPALPLATPLNHEPWDALNTAHLLLMETAITAAVALDLYYWAALVGLQRYEATDAGTFVAHAGNAGIALLQVALTRLPIVSYHFLAVQLYSAAYLTFLWLYGGLTGVWRYGLDWQQGSSLAAFILLPWLSLLLFAVWYGIARIREAVRGAVLARRRG